MKPRLTTEQGQIVSDILIARNGLPTRVTLHDGQVLLVHNVAWGRDMGVDFDHFSTNVSPRPDFPHSFDLFHADEVIEIVATESNEVLFGI